MVKIVVFTGKYDGLNEHRIDAAKKAAAWSVQHGADLLVFPGHSFQENWGPPKYVYGPQELCEEYKIRVLAEIHVPIGGNLGRKDDVHFKWIKGEKGSNDGLPKFPWQTFLFSPDKTPQGPMCQQFATSDQAEAKAMESWLSEINSGIRDFTIDGLRFRVLLCGELNYLTNKGPNLKVSVRHEYNVSKEYDVLLNPTHTNMGNLGKLYRRFKYLSSGGKTYIMTTNCTSQYFGSSCFYSFHDGEITMSGKNLFGSSDHWRMGLVEIL